MLQTVFLQRRHANRYRQITRTLIAHGLGGLVAPFDLGGSVRRLLRSESSRNGRDEGIDRRSRPVHLRLALEQLGPTFVKLGQILSTRSDLLPPPYIAELEKLQDRVPPEPFESITAVLESELGGRLSDIFASIDPQPMAAGSIGQVHAARLLDGTDVVVKVQRPGVDLLIFEDLEILADMARLGESRSAILRRTDVSGLVKEFSWTIRAELDFGREGANAERLGDYFADDPGISIPHVFGAFSTQKVLTLSRIDGVRIDRYQQNAETPTSACEIAERLVIAFARQILDVGMFHADPHPGNFLVTDEGALGILDFGMVGAIDDRLLERLLLLALAVTNRDSTRLVDEFARIGALPAGWDRHLMERDISHLVSRYVGATLRELPLTSMVNDAMELIRRHGLRLPSELAMLAKTASMLEALCRRLDPDIDVVAVVTPTIRQSMKRFYSPAFWGKRLRLQPLDAMLLGASLPGQMQRLLSRIDRNDLTFHVHYDELDRTLQSLNRMVNRLALAVMTAAAWVGLILLFFAVKPDLSQFPGNLFLVASAILVMVVLYGVVQIWRSGR